MEYPGRDSAIFFVARAFHFGVTLVAAKPLTRLNPIFRMISA